MVLAVLIGAQPVEPPLRICATTPDLGSLAREVGGDDVAVTVFARGTEDLHFLEARPSFIKAASTADLFIQTGMDLETGWAPPILENARNARILAGSTGFLDASTAVSPLEVPAGPIDRSMGDVHARGNPHYLTDPLNGLKVARLIADRLGDLRPSARAEIDARYGAFRDRLCAALVGEALAARYDAEKLALLFEKGRLQSFLDDQGDAALLGGWLGELSDARGTEVKAVADHNLWPYFARRYAVSVVAYLEPKPGVPPTTGHLKQVVETMERDGVTLILASPYFNRRHAEFVAERSGARVVNLTHQAGGRPGTDDYIAACAYNVRQLVEALQQSGDGH
jgi:ABC-type Zn uptake system ZnuABC Zn-binding protein ZnuA